MESRKLMNKDFSFEDEVKKAYERISKYILKTPLVHSQRLSGDNFNVYLKLENLQYTGSFKLRGAFNKLLSLNEEKIKGPFVTASTGNHAAAIAYALDKLNLKGTIFLPENVPVLKTNKLKKFDTLLQYHGTDSVETEQYARKNAIENKNTYISPYNDLQVIAGQGTISHEVLTQLSNVDYIFVTIGGGGLISGISGYMKSLNPSTKIIGCLPENSPVMYESIKQGKIIEMESKPTLSEGSAGGIELDSITFEFVKQYVDDYILVTETEIKKQLMNTLKEDKLLIEGAAAVAVAAVEKYDKINSLNGNVVVILCGGNIGLDVIFKNIESKNS